MADKDLLAECFDDFSDHRLTYENVDYIIHENGTSIYDSNHNIIGEYPTETVALEAIREMKGHMG